MAGSQILRDMGANWLECQDAQGIFYHNQVTQQSSDTIPAELMQQPMQQAEQPQAGQPESAVLRELPNNWLECQDAQGIYFFNKVTQQSSDTMPEELLVPDVGIGAVAAPMAAPIVQTMIPAAAPAMAAQPNVLRELPNNWLECQDEQGIFFFNQATQQSSDTLPAELAGFGNGAMAAPTTVLPVQQAAMTTIQAAPASYTPIQTIQQPYVQKVSAAAPSYTPLQMPQQQYIQAAPGSYLPAQQVAAAPASYLPAMPQQTQYVQQAPASYTPLALPQQQYLQQSAAPASYLPPQAAKVLTQQQYMQQAQPQVMYQQAQPQVIQAQPQVIQAQPQMMQGQPQMFQSQPQVVYQQPQQQMIQAAMQPAAQEGARKKSAFGDWVVYEDAQGEFFMQASTGQQFDVPPQAMVQSYQQHKAAGLVVG